MKTYSIFKVYDYKGGELSSKINLTRESLIYELSELFESMDFKQSDEYKIIARDKSIDSIVLDTESNETYVDYIKREAIEFMKGGDFYGTYAGSEAIFCGKVYEVEDYKLKLVNISDYLDEIAEIISKW
jgi:hypothetical protein